MKRRTLGAVAFAALAVLSFPMAAGCDSGDAVPTDGAEGGAAGTAEIKFEDITTLADGNNQFAFDLYRRLAGRDNLFFSPYSISTALAMTAAGARGNTETEMSTVLRLPLKTERPGPSDADRERVAATFAALQAELAADPEEDGYELNIANSLWGQETYPFKDTFVDLVAESFGGGFNPADFAGNAEAERVRINKWVEDETRERIVDLIPPGGVDAITTLVLTNAVYFKGEWASEFDAEKTSDERFNGAGVHSTVPMMYQKGKFRYAQTDVAQILEMPYVGDEVSMIAVLPNPDLPRGMRLLDASLTDEMFSGWLLELREQDVKVYFPRFELTWGTEDISGHLAVLGILDAFGGRADFTGMSDLQDLFVGPVFHKAFVKVNEEGTEAAAATAVVMKRLAIEHETVFRADRPFLFFIRDNATGSILFIGRIADLA